MKRWRRFFLADRHGAARGGDAHRTCGPQVWGKCVDDQTDGPRFASGQGMVLVQAYPEQDRAKGDRAWCHGVVVTKGWIARTDNKWAVYRGVRELSIEDGVREYGIGRHRG